MVEMDPEMGNLGTAARTGVVHVSLSRWRHLPVQLKMSQLLNTNDRKLLIKVAKFVYFGMKEYTSLPDVVSEEIDNVDLNCLYD